MRTALIDLTVLAISAGAVCGLAVTNMWTWSGMTSISFSVQPKTELSKFINAYKSASSRLLKQEFPGIRRKLWKEYFWSRSFCLLTTGGAPVEVIRKYIENQGEKSRTQV